jgi:hypothetical protein
VLRIRLERAARATAKPSVEETMHNAPQPGDVKGTNK